MLDPIPISVSGVDEHVDYSTLLKTAVWFLPADQLPQPYAPTLVKGASVGR